MDIKNLSFYEKKKIASEIDILLEVLNQLAIDEHKDVRVEVAGNLNCPIDILRKLANDKSNHVKIRASRIFK